MTANNPFSDPNFGAEASGTNNPFSNPEFGKPSGFTRRVADQGIKLAQGVVGVPEAAVGVADLVTGGQAGKLAEQAGVRFKDAKDILGEYLSPEQKSADAEVQKADGFLPTLGAMVRNPSTIIGSAVESAPSMLVGGAASRGLLAVAPKIGAIAAGAMGEGLTAAGQNAEQVRQEDPNGTLTPQQSAILAASGALTGGISLASGKLANKLGIGDVQTMLAAGKLGTVGEEAAQTAATKGFTRKLAEGFANEGVLQELPQSYQEQVAQNLAQDKPWDEGAAKAGAQGMMAGALMGGAANAASHFAEVGHEASPEKPGVAPPTQVVPALGYTPGINTHTVFPDGSVVVDSNTSSGEQNVRDMMRANRLARVGVEEAGPNSPLTSAAIVAVDTGADQGIVPAPQQVQAESDKNLKQSEIDQDNADIAKPQANFEALQEKPGQATQAQAVDAAGVGPITTPVGVTGEPSGNSNAPSGLDQQAITGPGNQSGGSGLDAVVKPGSGQPGVFQDNAEPGAGSGSTSPVLLAGGGTAAVAPKSAPTREQAITNASSAAKDVLTKGGTEADVNRAATDSLIGQMAGNPGIRIAIDAPAAVKAAKQQAAAPADPAQAAPETVVPAALAPADPPSKLKPTSIKQRMEQERAARADYFTPGNIVSSYDGHDEVLSYTPPKADGSDWSVKVRSVVKQDGKWVADPKDGRERIHSTQPDAKKLASGPTQRVQVATAAVADKDGGHIGRDSKPLSEGGKPFKSKDEASAARKLQPMLRVVPEPNGKGFALVPKTEAQLAAQDKAAKRLSLARTGKAGVPTAAHEFIAGEGGMDAGTKAEFSFGNNPKVGNRTLFAGARGGMSIEAATEKLIEARYLPAGANHSDTVALINRSFTQPQYTVDGTEVMAEAERTTRFEDHLAAEQDATQAEVADPFGPLTDHDFLVEVGYEQATPEVQAEFRALISLAEAKGTDAESIKMDVASRVGSAATDQEYHEAAITALKAALQGSIGDGGTVSGSQSQEARNTADEAGLTAPSRAEILAQQERTDTATKADAAQRRAQDLADKRERERKDIAKASEAAADTFVLGGDAEQNLSGQKDIFGGSESTLPISTGDFGPILTQYRHDAQGAIKALTDLQDGEAVAALHHPEVGDIDLVWGKSGTTEKEYEDGHGLAKISIKHPEVLADLQGFLLRLHKDNTQSGRNRIRLVDDKGTAVVRLQWNGSQKIWLLTAYENEVSPAADEGRTGVSINAETATPAEQGAGSGATVTPPAAESNPASEATAILDAANITGKERIDVLKDVKKGDITTEELEAAYPANVSASNLTSDGVGRRQDQTDTQAFKAWFGDSKVVDSKGKPLVMYHGTSKSEDGKAFTSFDTYASNYGLMGMGGYFTADPTVASSYTTKGKGESPTVYPVHLSIKNPIDMDAKANSMNWEKHFEDVDQYHEGGDSNESWYRAAEESLSDQGLPKWEGAEIMQDRLRAMGHDGITHIGGGRVKSDGIKHRVFIVFDPEQIKSATGNNGAFDPANPDIRYSRQETPTRGTPVPQVQDMVDAIKANWANAPDVVVVADMQDAKVPQKVREADQMQKSQGAEGEPNGFVYQGKVYLVAGELPTINDAVRVLFHEVLGHSGLRGAFGNALKPLLSQVASMRRADVVAKAREYGLLNPDTPHGATVNEQWQTMSEKSRMVAAEEVLAVMAEKHPELGFVKRAIAAIRNWLRTNVPGFKSLSMTDADIIQAFIFPARRQIEGRQSSSPVKNTSLEAIAQRELNLLDLIACLG